MNPRGLGQQNSLQLGGLGKYAAHNPSLLMGDSSQHNLLLSQPLSQHMAASQGLASRPMSSGTLCSTPNQPALSGVFRPNSAPSQHPSASQISHLPTSVNSPWHQASQNPARQDAGCADPAAGLGLQLGPAGRTGPRSLFQKKQLSVLGKPSPSSGLLARPDSAPSLQYAPPAHSKGLRGPGGSLMGLDMTTGTGAGLGGSSIRFAPPASQGGFRAAASRPLLPPDSQQDMEAYQPSQQQPHIGSQQQHLPEFGHSLPMLTQGSAGMEVEGPSAGSNRLQGAALLKQPHAGSSTSVLASRCAGQQQHSNQQHRHQQQQQVNPHVASFEATQATDMTEPSQQQPQHLLLDSSQPTPAASILPASTDTMLAAPPARCKQTAAVLQTPQAPVVGPAGAPGGPAPAPAAQHTPQAPAGDAAAAAAGHAATQEQQQQLLSRISTLEDHCCSMKDICERDIPLLLQHHEDSNKQLQALTEAANSTSTTNSTLHNQLQNLASSVASFMTEFRHWQEQHAGQGSTVLAHAECQTTPGLAAATAAAAAGRQDPTHPAAGKGAEAIKAPQSGGRADASADSSKLNKSRPSSARPSSSTHTAGLSHKGPADAKQQQASRQSGSLMDFLFSQPPAAAAAPAGPAAAAAATEAPSAPGGCGLLPSRAIMSPSGTRFQRSRGTPSKEAVSAGQDSQPQHTHSPFAVSMLAAPAAQAAAAAVASTGEDSKGIKGAYSSAEPTVAKPAATAAGRAKKAAAKRKPAADAAGKGRGRKAAPATAAADTAAGAAAAAAAGSRRQSARCSQKKAQQQQKVSSSDGLTQSKLVFQRATRSVAAAAAALGVTLSGDQAAADHTCRTTTAPAAPAPANDTAAAAAPPTAEEPSLKRQRLTAVTAGAACVADDAVYGSHTAAGTDRQQAAGEEQMPAWIPHDRLDSRQQQQDQQQQQGLVAFRRQNRPSQQQQQQFATAGIGSGAAITAAPEQQQAASALITAAFGAEVRPLGATSSKPSAAGQQAVNAPAGATGRQAGRLSSMQAAAGTGSAGKRGPSGHLLFGRAPAAAAVPPADAAAAGVAPNEPAAGAGVGRRSSQVARPSGGRKYAAATSSAVLLFGDVDDDAISKGTKRGRDSNTRRPSTAAAGEASKAALHAPGLPRPPAAAAPAPAAGPRGAAGLPLAAAAAGLPPKRPAAAPASQACYDFDAQSDSADDTDSDHSDSLDQHPSSRQRRDDAAADQLLLLQQQEQQRLSEAECKRLIIAKMERHRGKQRRSMAMASGGPQGGAWGMGGGLR